MEKYIYNDSESFKGMDIENSFEEKILMIIYIF